MNKLVCLIFLIQLGTILINCQTTFINNNNGGFSNNQIIVPCDVAGNLINTNRAVFSSSQMFNPFGGSQTFINNNNGKRKRQVVSQNNNNNQAFSSNGAGSNPTPPQPQFQVVRCMCTLVPMSSFNNGLSTNGGVSSTMGSGSVVNNNNGK